MHELLGILTGMAVIGIPLILLAVALVLFGSALHKKLD
jgi:hypothetical protein